VTVRTVLFYLVGAVAVGSGFAVFRVSSMARATFALALSFVAVGAVLLLLDLQYLGVITILMMVMEMSIMAVYMIMFMMNPGGLMPMSMYHDKAVAMTTAVGTFLTLTVGALMVPWPRRQGAAPPDVTLQLGQSIMGVKMLVMLTISPVLFTTIVAALVLATSRGRYDRLGDDLKQPSSDPVPGGVGR